MIKGKWLGKYFAHGASGPKLVVSKFGLMVSKFGSSPIPFENPVSGGSAVKLWECIFFSPDCGDIPQRHSSLTGYIYLKKGSKLDCILSLPMYRPTLPAQKCRRNASNSKICVSMHPSSKNHGNQWRNPFEYIVSMIQKKTDSPFSSVSEKKILPSKLRDTHAHLAKGFGFLVSMLSEICLTRPLQRLQRWI